LSPRGSLPHAVTPNPGARGPGCAPAKVHRESRRWALGKAPLSHRSFSRVWFSGHFYRHAARTLGRRRSFPRSPGRGSWRRGCATGTAAIGSARSSRFSPACSLTASALPRDPDPDPGVTGTRPPGIRRALTWSSTDAGECSAPAHWDPGAGSTDPPWMWTDGHSNHTGTQAQAHLVPLLPCCSLESRTGRSAGRPSQVTRKRGVLGIYVPSSAGPVRPERLLEPRVPPPLSQVSSRSSPASLCLGNWPPGVRIHAKQKLLFPLLVTVGNCK
jgi:hypothetical protein